jgi:uncharacterized protein YccT (UPF0319 family)
MFLFPILLSFIGCLGDKVPKEEPKKEVPKKEVYPIELDEKQKKVYKALQRYLNQLKALNANNIISMTYPKFFTVFSKRIYRSQILTMTNSSNIEIRNFSAKITKIDKVNTFSEGEFAKVGYNSTVKVHLKNNRLYDTELSLNTLYSILVRKYGRENIHVDIKTRVVTIKKQEKMLAIKENNDDWTFIGDNPTYRERYYPSFLPYDILDKI